VAAHRIWAWITVVSAKEPEQGDHMSEAIFYVVEIELAPADLPDFVDWYAAVHAPHLFNAGFRNCTSYLGVSGSMSVVDIYQADGWGMFEATAFQRYREVAARDRFRPKSLAGIRNTRSVYHHLEPTPLPSHDPAAPLDTDWISILRFDGDAAIEARIAAWLREGGASAVGVQQARFLRRGRDAPTGRSDRPHLALVMEWRERPPAMGVLMARLPDWLAALLKAQDHFTGWRLYPWADDPTLRIKRGDPAGA
jgi:hypothetical protein